VVAIAHSELEAGHAAGGEPILLERTSLIDARGDPLAGLEPVPVERVDPWEFGWEPADLAALRPPAGASQAVFFEPAMPVSQHIRHLRIVHVRTTGVDDASYAIFELKPDPQAGHPMAYVALPVTTVVDFFVVTLSAGFILGFAGLGM
jgi:hypothetical protein